MTLKDRIYGTFETESPVIGELLSSPAMLRLRNISQMGPPTKYYHLENYSRYEHSIGVFLILHKLGAPLEEQVAGLLHDISHTAFSHVIDWVVGSGASEDYQDESHGAFIRNTGILPVLRKHGIPEEAAVNYKKYPLLEQDIPALCADRVDYALREFDPAIAKKCFAGLTAHNNRIVFRDKDTARTFARNFLERQMGHWGGYEAVTRYRLFADALRDAMEDGSICLGDFNNDEETIVARLESSSNPDIRRVLETLRHKDLSFLPHTRKKYHKKFRYVDPAYLENGALKTLSREDREFAGDLEEARRKNDEGIRIGQLKR